jgi:hypothetical protein
MASPIPRCNRLAAPVPRFWGPDCIPSIRTFPPRRNLVDVYLNGDAHWSAVPINVWNYTLGGYQVLKNGSAIANSLPSQPRRSFTAPSNRKKQPTSPRSSAASPQSSSSVPPSTKATAQSSPPPPVYPLRLIADHGIPAVKRAPETPISRAIAPQTKPK